MKHTLRRWAAALMLGCAVALFTPACTTPADKVAVTAVGIQVTTVDSAMKAWADYVNSGKATQAQVDKVKEAYVTYYKAALVEKAAFAAYVTTSTNATAWETASAVVIAAEQPLLQLLYEFLPTSTVTTLKASK